MYFIYATTPAINTYQIPTFRNFQEQPFMEFGLREVIIYIKEYESQASSDIKVKDARL